MKFAVMEMLLHWQMSGCSLICIYHGYCSYE